MVAPAVLAAGVSAVGSFMGGLAKRGASRARARAMQAAARNARREAGVTASLQLEESDRVGARAATQAAMNGGGLQGSALDVIDDLARQGMYRARQTVRDGVSQSVQLMNDAQTAKRQGDLELFSSMVEASSTFLGGIGQEANARRGRGEALPGWMKWAG